jgi:hypothetical protein
MRKKLMLLCLAGLSLTLIAACANDAPVVNLCGSIHPIHGFSDIELNALSVQHKIEIVEQNCKIEKTCGYTPDKVCQ